ncbi:hypothetical protein [Planotetraspora phitsanulokensis]|uniref:hypothetical protein n=1 Tax=Planotetraspora phitsanulokensis TaxID=575192 RepID=UPI0019509F7C|nr:hypothetical protein [Planotetraspora phitsanulokensis]
MAPLIGLLGGVAALIWASYGDQGIHAAPSPAIALDARYSGVFSCELDCVTWSGTERLTFALASDAEVLADALTSELGRSNWGLERSFVRPDALDRVELQFTRQTTTAEIPLPSVWPPTVSHRITVTPLVQPQGYFSLREADLAKESLGWLSNEQREWLTRKGSLEVYLGLDPASSLVLRYPVFAVTATTPSSDGHAIAQGRGERVIGLGDPDLLEDGGVVVDVLARKFRQQQLAAVVTAGPLVWVLTVVLAMLLIVVGIYKERLTARLGGLLPWGRAADKDAPPESAPAQPASPQPLSPQPVPPEEKRNGETRKRRRRNNRKAGR